jgi:Spy/CpxP family protein refolding chaperone
MKRWLARLAVVTLTLGLAAPAAADPKPHGKHPATAQAGKNKDTDGKGGKRERLQKKLRERRARVLREGVGLDEKTAQAAEKILDKHQAERERHEATQREEKKRLRALLDLDQNDQAAYTRSLRNLLDIQQKLAKLRQQEFDELGKVLTPKQQAKLARAIDETMAQLRNKLRRRDAP